MATKNKKHTVTERNAPAVIPPSTLDTQLAFSMRQAAQILGVSYMSMHRMLKRGLIKSSSALRTKVIPRSELEKFLSSTLG